MTMQIDPGEAQAPPFLLRARGGIPLARAVARAVAQNPDEWLRFTERQDYPGSPHAATRTMYLRFLPWPGLTVDRIFGDLTVVDWPALQLIGEFRWMLEEVGKHLPGPIARAVIVELAPGGEVAAHVDEGLYSACTERHHFGIASGPEAKLWVGAEGKAELHVGEGELWTLDKDRLHGAQNFGPTPRLHLIVDSWKNGGLRNG